MGAGAVRTARFLFVGRLDPEGSRAPEWPWAGRVAPDSDGRRPDIAIDATAEAASTSQPDDGSTWFAWVLVSSNNRELGRSRAVFESYRASREAALHLQRSAGSIRAELAADDEHGRYGWRLDLDGATVAVSGRWYQRERESRYSLDKFLAALPLAGLGGGVRQIDGRSVRRLATQEPNDRGLTLRRIPLQSGPSPAPVGL